MSGSRGCRSSERGTGRVEEREIRADWSLKSACVVIRTLRPCDEGESRGATKGRKCDVPPSQCDDKSLGRL